MRRRSFLIVLRVNFISTSLFFLFLIIKPRGPKEEGKKKKTMSCPSVFGKWCALFLFIFVSFSRTSVYLTKEVLYPYIYIVVE